MNVENNSEPVVSAKYPKKVKNRGLDVLEAFPGMYQRLDNGQIIKVKVDAGVAV